MTETPFRLVNISGRSARRGHLDGPQPSISPATSLESDLVCIPGDHWLLGIYCSEIKLVHKHLRRRVTLSGCSYWAVWPENADCPPIWESLSSHTSHTNNCATFKRTAIYWPEGNTEKVQKNTQFQLHENKCWEWYMTVSACVPCLYLITWAQWEHTSMRLSSYAIT